MAVPFQSQAVPVEKPSSTLLCGSKMWAVTAAFPGRASTALPPAGGEEAGSGILQLDEAHGAKNCWQIVSGALCVNAGLTAGCLHPGLGGRGTCSSGSFWPCWGWCRNTEKLKGHSHKLPATWVESLYNR